MGGSYGLTGGPRGRRSSILGRHGRRPNPNRLHLISAETGAGVEEVDPGGNVEDPQLEHRAAQKQSHRGVAIVVVPVVLANLEVADRLGVAFLPSLSLFAFVGGAGGCFLGLLSPAHGASA